MIIVVILPCKIDESLKLDSKFLPSLNQKRSNNFFHQINFRLLIPVPEEGLQESWRGTSYKIL